ncbi:MAG: hypothetical protein GXZ02_00645 [Clostridiales bacterium]|nr:hypothetical protein [Clostridiales bacterium]
MKKTDFLLLYEHKARELENLCLLKFELDRRGYKTEIIHISDTKNQKNPVYLAKVVAVPCCYNNESLKWATKHFVKFDKVINMQWEQIFRPEHENDQGSIYSIDEIAKAVVHISWGKNNYLRLTQQLGINPENVKITGHLSLDFLREELRGYYRSKEELFSEYGFPPGKKVCLFVSSFSYPGLPNGGLADIASKLGNVTYHYYQQACESQKGVLRWFRMALEERSDIVIVYRPHPSETIVEALSQLDRDFENFHIICDYSVKQWVITCDRVYTWLSTAITEAYYAGKQCHILRPIVLSENDDAVIFKDALTISDFEAFSHTIEKELVEFPVKSERIEENYATDWATPTYKKVADVFENVLKENRYKLKKKQLNFLKTNSKSERKSVKDLLIVIIKRGFIKNAYEKLLKDERIHLVFIEKRRALRNEALISQSEMAQSMTIEKESDLNQYLAYLKTINLRDETNKEEIDIIIARIEKSLNHRNE